MQRKFPNGLTVYMLGNISSESLLGSIGVFFSEVLKTMDANIDKLKERLKFQPRVSVNPALNNRPQ